MISRFAEAEYDAMLESGLKPTFADIVRLNSAGCKVDHGSGDADIYRLRRVAVVGGAVIKEPTLGHMLKLAEISQCGFDTDDEITGTILRAWLFSLRDSELDTTYDAESASSEIIKFAEDKLRFVTFRRLKMAVEYAMFGDCSTAGENPPRRPDEDDTAREDVTADETSDVNWSFDLGVLYMGEVVRLGISLDDARRHTPAQLQTIIQLAVDRRNAANVGTQAVKEAKRNRAVEDFYATLAEIRTRLENEKELN